MNKALYLALCNRPSRVQGAMDPGADQVGAPKFIRRPFLLVTHFFDLAPRGHLRSDHCVMRFVFLQGQLMSPMTSLDTTTFMPNFFASTLTNGPRFSVELNR